MILHLGEDAVVPMDDIIAIVDMETIGQSNVNREFMQIARDEGFIQHITKDPPKSAILAEVNHKTILFLSPISSITLMKRSRQVIGMIDNREENKGETK